MSEIQTKTSSGTANSRKAFWSDPYAWVPTVTGCIAGILIVALLEAWRQSQ